MLYVKYKEITREFNFSKVINKSELPGYIKHYIFEDELVLSAYKTSRDHGVFTDTKIVLFDNYSKFGIKKQIYTIPYNSISTIAVTFEGKRAELNIFLNSGHPLHLIFIDVKPEDKVCLRVLYTCINRIISGKNPLKEDIKKLVNNDFFINNANIK